MPTPYNDLPRVSTAFTYNDIDAAYLENKCLRILVLPGKGGDIVRFVDKRRDVNVLWEGDHNWIPPADGYVPTGGESAWQTDHYPGGWQVNMPLAGNARTMETATYGLHGESALVPWEAHVHRDDDETVTLRLETELVRYPFEVRRDLTLHADAPRLFVRESVTNTSRLDLDYVWQQHVALGRPLVGPAARLDVPTGDAIVPPYGDDYPNARLDDDTRFEWPDAPSIDGGTVDLSEDFPDFDAEHHDLVFATDLRDGWYAVTNPDLDLGFAFAFPHDHFESLWYWQPFGGFADPPYFNRNYNVGLEPTTSTPNSDADQTKSLGAGETVKATFVARTYTDISEVDAVTPDGDVSGTPIRR